MGKENKTYNKNKGNKLCGVTPTGFRYKIRPEALDDFELLEDFAKADDGDVTALVRATVKILGENQKKKLYDHLRTDKGNVPIEKFTQEVLFILNNSAKN